MSSFSAQSDGSTIPDVVPFKSDSSLSAEEKETRYQNILDEAMETDMADLERSGCVGIGSDNNNHPILMFIPKLGFARADKSDATLRRMLLLFIKTADSVVKQPYSICYAHTSLSILSQQPIVYRYYKMLPRAYKKNLQKLYVLQPTQIIRLFFEMGVRWFISEKFYRKLNFVDSIAEYQSFVSPFLCQLPHALIKSEDDEIGLKGSGFVAPLEQSFDPKLSSTRLIHKCCEYIRTYGLQRKGIFRVSGDEVALTLVKTRAQAPSYTAASPTVLIGNEDPDNCLATAAYSVKSSKSERSATIMPSCVVINDVDTVAQVLKMLLRSLPEPLVPFDCYQPLLSAAKNMTEEQFQECLVGVTECMPPAHSSTLKHLMTFLSEIVSYSETNSMDAENIARIFAPTIMRSREDETYSSQNSSGGSSPPLSAEMMQQDLLKAATELNLCKIVVQRMLKVSEGSDVPAGNNATDTPLPELQLNAKMLSRLERQDSGRRFR